jgi:hypothetical protein
LRLNDGEIKKILRFTLTIGISKENVSDDGTFKKSVVVKELSVIICFTDMLHFSALRNGGFQRCLLENSNLITNILVDLPAIMKG